MTYWGVWSHEQRIRMDILTDVAFLPTRVTEARKKDDGKLVIVLTKSGGTQDISYVLDGKQGIIALEVFADASHAVHDDAKGRVGAIARTGNASVYAISIMQ